MEAPQGSFFFFFPKAVSILTCASHLLPHLDSLRERGQTEETSIAWVPTVGFFHS